ncbi:MAG TPA: desulfoferrodoxin [Candidatus Bathyarchaeota archaeon]|nr:desulfoferrodoxin [Candidatus Bathyarchaeota archaeon]
MTEKLQIYKCDICGNIVLMMHSGVGQLVCCGQPMRLMEEKGEASGYEKHLPVVERVGGEVRVKIGSIPHPMEEDHYIEWIEVETEKGVMVRFLKPGDKPEAVFKTDEEILKARDYCNLHGLWMSK